MSSQLTGLRYLEANEIKNMKCDMDKPYVFFSYSHNEFDAQIVMNVFKALYSSGYNIWIDTANMPHDENSWKTAAKKALVNLNCVLAFYFRSESSMKKETIAKELETIKVIDHIKRIVAVDIWQESGMDANKFRNRLLNSGVLNEACERICDCVDIENRAIRLETDARNDIQQLVEEMKEVMQENGIEGASRGKNNGSQAASKRVSSSAAGRAPGDRYTFVLYGNTYTNKKLKELMLTVFKAVMPRHLDKMDELMEKLPCLREGSVIEKDAKPAVFRAGEVVDIGDKQISIGTSLGRPAVLSYIGKLMSICGEARENLKIERYEY